MLLTPGRPRTMGSRRRGTTGADHPDSQKAGLRDLAPRGRRL